MIPIEGWSASNGTMKAVFSIDNDYPLVSLISKIDPSPDWIIGVSNLRLCRGDGWMKEHHMDLTAYDCGIDNGVSYTSLGASENSSQGIRELKWRTITNPSSAFYAQHGGVIPPYATLRLQLVNVSSEGCPTTKKPTGNK